MEKPHTFAGRVVQKHGKITANDYEQPEKFFAQMTDYLRLLDDVPFKAIEDLKKYELNRDVMINVLRRLLDIFDAAGVDVIAEMDRQDEDPFEGLEDDLALKKAIKISGEE